MGIRQPTRTGTFFAQAKAGAESQKEARDTLKKPQALGGSAAAGTAMVANTTGVQQSATADVKTAATDMNTAVTTAMKTPPSATSGVYTAPQPSTVPEPIVSDGNVNTTDEVTNTSNTLTALIKTTTAEIDALNAKIAAANAEDAKRLQEQKAALEKIVQDAQDKLTKGNLGKIAGPSTFETEMSDREDVLATKGNNVGKLAQIFGPRYNASKYGALGSQIYGKDLEAIQLDAAAGLEEQARAEERADTAEKEYVEGIAANKTKVADKLKSEQAKLDFLKKTPDELAIYSRDELKKIFGFEDVTDSTGVVTNEIDKIFNFDPNTGKSTGTKLTATQLALTARNTSLADKLVKNELEKPKALAKEEEKYNLAYNDIIGSDQNTGMLASGRNAVNQAQGGIDTIAKIISDTKNARFSQNWKGISKDEGLVKGMQSDYAKFQKATNIINAKIENAQKTKDTALLIASYKEYEKLKRQLGVDLENKASQFSHTFNQKAGGYVQLEFRRLKSVNKYS